MQEETIVELLWSYHAASSVAFFISFLSNPGSKDPSNILFNYKISFLWHSVSLQICLSLYTCNYNSKFHFCDIQFHYRFVSPCTPVQKCNYNSNFHFCDIQFHYRFVSPCTLVITILSLGKSSSMCYYITVIDFLHIFFTNVVSSNNSHGEVYSIQDYLMQFVSDLQHVGGFTRVLQFPPPIKLIAMI